MVNKFKEVIDVAEKIIVLCHINSDCDALGSAYAVTELLRTFGKNVRCVLEEKPERKHEFLSDCYEVYSEDEVYECDLCISVDCGSRERIGKRLRIFDNSPMTVNIDHHKSNTSFGDLNFVEPTYAAAAELIAEIFEKCGYKLTVKIAELLYAGIISDSGCFKFSSTRPETLRTAAGLLEYGFDHAELAHKLFDSVPPELIKYKGYIMNNIECRADGKIALVETRADELESFGVNESDASDIINIPRTVAGAEIAIEVKDKGGVVRVSLRSNGMAEVDRVAAVFGGGGHIRAAGATMENMTFEEAKAAVIAEAEKEINRISKKPE